MSDQNQERDDNPNSGKSKTTTVPSGPYRTDFRRSNPLAPLSSYTYNLCLYVVTPECVNYFATNGSLDPAGGWYIIAQSGGIGGQEPRALTLDEQGMPGPGKPGLDLFIDDLNIETFLLTKDGQKTATTSTTVTFKVTEPTGFTFLNRLARATQQINKASVLLGNVDASARPNLYQQHYMLGIRFYGYDENGRVIESRMIENNTTTLNDQYAIFERIFPLVLSAVKTKIDGRATVYNFEGVTLSMQAAFGSKRNVMPTNAYIDGSTVGQILGSKDVRTTDSLIGWLNDNQQTLYDKLKVDIPQEYDILWDKTAEEIKNSPLVASNPDAANSPMSNAATVQQSNVKTAQQAQTINVRSKYVNISGGTSIVSMIDQIVVKSSYIADTLTKKNNADIEADALPGSPKTLQWYAINPVVTILGRDKILNDWAYSITYQIATYSVPYIRSQYVGQRSAYYGPIKEYSYFLTGENTEVISYEMEYNNKFYTADTPVTNKDKNSSIKDPAPRAPTGDVQGNQTGGNLNSADAVVQTVRANLYSPADQATASIKIIGDPDFLMDITGKKIPPLGESFSRFYGKNGSISPYGGQVFIEIIFKVAEDYGDDGLLDVDPTQTIAFYPLEQQQLLKNRGLIYKVISVKSSFNRGKFEQVLSLIMVPPSQLILPATKNNENARADIRRIDNQIEAREANTIALANNTSSGADARVAGVNPEQLGNSYYETGYTPETYPDSSYPGSNTALNPLQNTQAQKNTSTGKTTNDDANVSARALRENRRFSENQSAARGNQPTDETSLSVNERLRQSFTGGGNESLTLINRARARLGIPVGGTCGGGG